MGPTSSRHQFEWYLVPALEQQARGAGGTGQGQEVEHVTDAAGLAACDAELVTAPNALQQVPSPFERERMMRNQLFEILEALAKPVAVIDVGFEIGPRRAFDTEQAVREQQVREHARLERAQRRAYERPDTR